jgi:hypothetical protein
MRVDFVSRSLTSRNSFVLINYIPDTQIILVQLSTHPHSSTTFTLFEPDPSQPLLQLQAGWQMAYRNSIYGMVGIISERQIED